MTPKSSGLAPRVRYCLGIGASQQMDRVNQMLEKQWSPAAVGPGARRWNLAHLQGAARYAQCWVLR